MVLDGGDRLELHLLGLTRRAASSSISAFMASLTFSLRFLV